MDPKKKRNEAGMTLLEVIFAGGILSVALVALSQVVGNSVMVSQANRETALAGEAIRQMVEQIQNTQISQVFTTYNADPNDDPLGPGTAPGKNFIVPGLPVLANDPDGMAGEIIFPTDPGGALREDLLNTVLAMPRDLNGDNVIDGNNHATDYILLPVIVQVQWEGTRGETTRYIATLLSNR